MSRYTLPTPEIAYVTPDIAREWLTHNTHNRNPKSARFAYAKDMANDDWRPEIGDPIRFAKDGTLLDGQNRLMAVVESGVTIPFYVIRDLPNESQNVMDGHAPRKLADVLKLNGEEHAAQLAASLRLAYEWTQGSTGRMTKGIKDTSTSQLLRFLDEHPELREYATQKQRSVADACHLPASIVGVLWWGFAHIDEEDADYFFERLASDEDHHKGQPIHELRRTLQATITDKSRRGGRDRVWLMAVTVKAWNAYRDGETVGLYRWKPGGKNPEKFPVPK